MLSMKWFAMASAAAALASQGGLFSTRTGLALAGFLMLLGLTQQLPGFRKTAAAVLIATAAVTVLLPALAARMRTDWPLSSVSVRERQMFADSAAAELAAVKAHRAKTALAEFCRWMDARQSDWVAGGLKELRRPFEPPSRPRPSLWQRVRGEIPAAPPRGEFPIPDLERIKAANALIRFIELSRQECVSSLLPQDSPAATELKNWPERIADWFTGNPRLVFWAVITLLLAALAVAAVTGQVKVWPAAKSGALLIFAALIASWLVWGGGQAHLPRAFGGGGAIPVAGAYRISMSLRGGEWKSVHDLIPPCTRYTLDTSGVRGPRIRFADGKEEAIADGKEFGRRKVVALHGDGTLGLWLHSPGSSC